jgi:hypothetical protein
LMERITLAAFTAAARLGGGFKVMTLEKRVMISRAELGVVCSLGLQKRCGGGIACIQAYRYER